MATSDVAICNFALQKLGAKRITSLTEDSPNARTMNACYEIVRDAELRRHVWSFAIAREALAADVYTATFGPTYRYSLPADFLRLLPRDPEENYNTTDWRIEGRKIYTEEGAPLNVRYIKRVTDPNEFDAAFVDAFAARLAWHSCEDITQSNQKKADILNEYTLLIREAKRTNAIEKQNFEEAVDDPWVTARL